MKNQIYPKIEELSEQTQKLLKLAGIETLSKFSDLYTWEIEFEILTKLSRDTLKAAQEIRETMQKINQPNNQEEE